MSSQIGDERGWEGGFGDASEKQEIELNNGEQVENYLNVRKEQERSSRPPSGFQRGSFLSGVPSSPLGIIHQEGTGFLRL